jgi:ATP:corrinoid adenosyltransferase
MSEVNVYMQDGRVFKYNVVDVAKAREHAHRIITTGWRNVQTGVMEYYPVHQVLKVTFQYQDDYLGTKYEGESK